TCGAGMTLRTGKSGRYRYYTCAGCAQKGKSHCPGRSIGMPRLDSLVIDHLAQRMFTPERLTRLLVAYTEQSKQQANSHATQVAQARKAVTEAQGRIERLLTLVEQGDMAADDPAMRQRLAAARLARHEAEDRVKRIEAAANASTPVITPAKIDRLGASLRELLSQDDTAARKAYLRLFIDQVVVADDEIRLRGPIEPLAKAAATGELPPAALVPSFVQTWRRIANWV
ncbi:MAG: zinc ribbon domain-containing protein, partial [Zoogloea sp.]|nr:zinc ribbon domain-containing protein [Zoogloea sp.]